MNNKLIIFLASLLVLSMACSSTKDLIIPAGDMAVIDLPARTSRLSPEQARAWNQADLMTDTIPGISLEKAYQYLDGRSSTTVIVGVADTGLDVDHEDLKDVVWKNGKEVQNGKDDDGNGFVDDLSGWNFLGDTYNENLEMTRMVRNFKAYFGNKSKAEVAPEEMKDYELYKKLEKEVAEKFAGSGYYYNLEFNARKDSPDPYDYSVKIYGDNKIKNTETGEAHASHVSGIIAANRNNDLGIRGIADNVKIMPLRVVPKGDEYDKDVALGIRYAVDQGAKVINASFGKGYSPNVDWVYDAIRYAAEKDVLLVLSSGNNGDNIDEVVTYPNDRPGSGKEISDNVLMVGAITPRYDESLVAPFSNYGKQNVDIFAPGVSIYSTVPDNRYRAMSGTSMAAPAAAGVAALLRSYFPKLTAAQVKKIIMNSGTRVDMEVMTPGGDPKLVPFSELSVSGRILNAYNAVKMADGLLNK